jgi:hypothetical protein
MIHLELILRPQVCFHHSKTQLSVLFTNLVYSLSTVLLPVNSLSGVVTGVTPLAFGQR